LSTNWVNLVYFSCLYEISCNFLIASCNFYTFKAIMPLHDVILLSFWSYLINILPYYWFLQSLISKIVYFESNSSDILQDYRYSSWFFFWKIIKLESIIINQTVQDRKITSFQICRLCNLSIYCIDVNINRTSTVLKK
jgi:hypothetical protein